MPKRKIDPTTGQPQITYREQRMVDEFFNNGGNGSQAAAAAGYSAARADQSAYQVLRRPEVQRRIRERIEEYQVCAHEIIGTLNSHLRGSLADFIDESGDFSIQTAKKNGVDHLLKSITVTTREIKATATTPAQVIRTYRATLHSPSQAATALARILSVGQFSIGPNHPSPCPTAPYPPPPPDPGPLASDPWPLSSDPRPLASDPRPLTPDIQQAPDTRPPFGVQASACSPTSDPFQQTEAAAAEGDSAAPSPELLELCTIEYFPGDFLAAQPTEPESPNPCGESQPELKTENSTKLKTTPQPGPQITDHVKSQSLSILRPTGARSLELPKSHFFSMLSAKPPSTTPLSSIPERNPSTPTPDP